MLKVAGLIILIISGTLKGISISEKYLKRVRFLNSYINFLIHLKSEISYTGKTLFEILKNYSCPKPLETRLNKCLTDSKFNSFENSWENAFSDISYETGITNDETAMIINFGKELGNYNIQEQISHINHYINLFQIKIKDAQNKLNSKGKLTIILGICISFAIALILI